MYLPRPAAYAGAGVIELVGALRDAAAGEIDRAWVDAMSDLLVDAVVRALRERPRRELLDAALALGEFLATPGARHYEDTFVGTWQGVLELLGRASAATDVTAIDSILRSHNGKAGKVLEVLAERNGSAPRAELKRQIAGISESHLSHVLRDLEEARLVVRERAHGRETVVSLTPRGGEAVARTVLPPWVDDIRDAVEGRGPDVAELADRLRKNGVPSELAARRLAEALAAPVELSAAFRDLIDHERGDHPRVDRHYGLGRRPVEALQAAGTPVP